VCERVRSSVSGKERVRERKSEACVVNVCVCVCAYVCVWYTHGMLERKRERGREGGDGEGGEGGYVAACCSVLQCFAVCCSVICRTWMAVCTETWS